MLTERSIINFLVWTGGLILGPYLAITAVELNPYPVGIFAGACLLALVFGYMRDRMALVPLIGLSVAGKINLIPVLHPAPSEFFPLLAILYYVIAYLALQRKMVLTGPLLFFVPIAVLAGIILYHEHSFGLRSLGNGKEGGRGAVFVLVAAITYVCGVSMNSPSPRFLSLIPVFCAGAVTLSAIPYIVTTYYPGAAPLFYIFTDNINENAYAASVLVETDIVRNQAQAGVGASIVSVLLAYFPIYTWWRPHRWWVALLALCGVGLVIMGGYRSALSTFGVTVLISIWCYSSWRALFIIPPMVLAVVLAVSLQNSHVIQLPESAQRSLAFLPGDWDREVLASTDSSNEFRQKIQQVYMKEDARKSPFLGNGISYDEADFERYTYLAKYGEVPDGYYTTEMFVTGKMFHIGWISLYDAVGIVGFAPFVFLLLALIGRTAQMIFRKGVNRRSPLFPVKVWMLSNLGAYLFGYFTVFGDFKEAFPCFCYFAVLWTHLYRVEKYGYRPPVPIREVPFDPSRTQVSEAV